MYLQENNIQASYMEPRSTFLLFRGFSGNFTSSGTDANEAMIVERSHAVPRHNHCPLKSVMLRIAESNTHAYTCMFTKVSVGILIGVLQF